MNGRKVNRDYRLQLNPKLIDKIKVITNLGVKYDSHVDAVINLIRKKEMQYGLSGRLRLEVPTSKTIIHSSNSSLYLFFKKVRLYIAGNFGIRRFDMESTTVGNNTSLLTQNTNSVTTTKAMVSIMESTGLLTIIIPSIFIVRYNPQSPTATIQLPSIIMFLTKC